tara:strand:+ start:3312 stop:3578 length:267 start_codon:yes stop_codon:yes gene_type:complete
MIPALIVYWNRDKDGVGFWKVKMHHTNVGAMRFPTKLEALEYANQLFRDENWVLLTVLNKDDSQDHCTSKFKDEPLWNYLNETKKEAS